MADLRSDVIAIRDPSRIKNARLASSPYVLRKAFAKDPTIARLVGAGEKVIPLIHEQMLAPESLDEITLAAFAYIVASVDPRSALRLFRQSFCDSVENPGPFFVHFAAHAIRTALRLPVKPVDVSYSRRELIETQNAVR